MTATDVTIHHFDSEDLYPVSENIDGFLQQLGGPAWIHIKGENSQRTRVVTTLLHGNEPSGSIALHRCLLEGKKPVVDLHCFIASTEAALTPPLFTQRSLPGHADLNRCFQEPFEGVEGSIARQCLEHIEKLAPEAVIDIHNTSGDGPAFGVSAYEKTAHNALAACFTHRMVITDLRFGALLEATREDLHIVTVECGGNQESSSHQLAYDGLCRYLLTDDLYSADLSREILELLKHPLRLELAAGSSLTHHDQKKPGFDVTVAEDIEQHNFGEVTSETTLGWLGDKGLDALTVNAPQDKNLIRHYFTEQQSRLVPKIPLKLFMATPNPEIAASDCLCYFVTAE
ncbi:MAG: hypothetical protein DRQ60_00635 [Gammaproteobacteria bacterium]|nr:MAG: hypothetical protein DRQ54_02270 [Gammaproteobacteria bacterium]RLA15491.1 MAG: hypothetical protein DRQ52_01680 [Gammaproteobacteria bacterium]RLA17974.1 MAG: hypothetical protein DRQ60_00635 [Gammaproteobacteria bacterium]